MKPEKVYRESCRVNHRRLAAYLSILAWGSNLDAIVLTRKHLLPFLGVGSMRNKRVKWFKEDIDYLFSFVKQLNSSSGKRYETVYLSRDVLPSEAFQEAMSDLKRVKLLSELGVSAKIVELPNENQILRTLSDVSHGLIDFSEIIED